MIGDELQGAVQVTADLLVNAQQVGWASAQTIGSFAAIVALGVLFAVIETRSSDPLVPFAIFRSAPLRRAQVGAITLFGSYVSFQILLTKYLQSLAHRSAISTPLSILPGGMIVEVLS